MNHAGSITLAALTIAALFAAACGSAATSGPDSPSGVSKRFVEAAQQKDAQTFKSLLSKRSIASVEKEAKAAGLTTDQMIARVLEQDLFPKGASPLETRNEKISGDTATVEFQAGDGRWLQNELVREDGVWKVELE